MGQRLRFYGLKALTLQIGNNTQQGYEQKFTDSNLHGWG